MTDRSKEDDLRSADSGPESSGAGADGAASAPAAGPSSWHALLDRATLRSRERGHRRRRLTLLILLALTALLAGGYHYMTSDKQIERQAEAFLSDFFQTPVNITSASFSFLGGVQVEGLSVEMEGQDEPIFSARRLRLSHDPLALLTGRLVVREIVAINPTINLLSRDNEWNFERLTPKGSEGGGPPQRPVIYVQEGVVNVRQFQGGQNIYQHSLQVSGVLQPASGRPNVFTFFASDVESGTVRGSISRGVVNMAEGSFSFEARATNVELTPALAQSLPPEARQVWNRFMPSGMVSLKVTFRDDHSSERGFGFWVEADLNGVALAYEHGGQRFHLEDLTGQCAISRDVLILHDVHGVLTNVPHERLAAPVVAGVQGSAEVGPEVGEASQISISVGLSGEVRGMDLEHMGYDLEITADDLDLLRMRRFATGMSHVMRSLYKDFEPEGRADVHLWVHRKTEADANVDVRGNIALRSGRCRTLWFPYPIDDVYGDITLEPGSTIVNLSGRNGDTRVTASGEVTGADHDTGIKLLVVAKRLALDDKLRQALDERYQEYVEFFDSLNPQGLIDLEIKIDRPVGGHFDIVNTIHLHDAALTYAQFPYRLDNARGKVVDRKSVV